MGSAVVSGAVDMNLKLFFIFLILLPSIHALDCNLIANKQWCNDIQNSNIPQTEKDYLLSDIISDSKLYPDHQLVKQWNSKISTTTVPDDVVQKSSEYVKNSWVKIFAVMPSVLMDDTLYISNKGEVLVGYNHNVQIPSYTESGDCKTERELTKNTGTLQLYLNNNYVGKGHSVKYLTYFSQDTDAIIKVVYTAEVQVKIKHYTQQKKYYWINGKKKYNWVCELDHTEYKTDKIVTSDILETKIHNLPSTATFTVKDKNLVKAEFIPSDYVNAELNFYDSYLKKHNYVFSEVFSMFPLNVLTVKAEKKESVEEKNLVYADDEVIVPKTDGCQIKLYDFFYSEILSCDLSYQDNSFTLETDKTVYAENETIKLEISPEREYIVNYADKNYTATGSLELKAEYPYNKITVQYKGSGVNKLIHVKNDKPLNLAFSLVVFGMVNYSLIGVIRKCWGGILE